MGHTRWHRLGRDWPLSADAAPLVHGALELEPSGDGWLRPMRLTASQRRAVGSCAAWHPALFRQMAACTAGVTVEFVTDAQEAALEVWCDPEPRGTRAQTELADGGPTDDPHDGVSADVEDHHLGPVMPPAEPVELVVDLNDGQGTPPLPGMAPLRHVRVWLPCLRGCRIRRVCCDGTVLEPVAPRPMLLVLGDSISQGFLADDPAGAWASRVAAQAGLDLVNQGLGGQVFQPTALAGLAAACSPDVVWVALGANYRFDRCSVTEARRDIKGVLDEVARAWPDAPVFVATPTPHYEEDYPSHRGSCFREVPRLLAEQAGRHGFRLVDGDLLLEDRHRYFADADHPSLRGHRLMGLRIGRVLRGEPPIDTHEARARRLAERRLAEQAGLPVPPEPPAEQEAMALDVAGAPLLDGDGMLPPDDMDPIDLAALGDEGDEAVDPIAPTPVAGASEAVAASTGGPSPASFSPEDLGRRGATAHDVAALVDRLAKGPVWELPVREAVVRGIGEVAFAHPHFASVELPHQTVMLWGDDAELAMEVLAHRPRPKVALVMSPVLLDALGAAYEGVGEPSYHRTLVYDSRDPVPLRTPLVVAPLGPDDRAFVEAHYSSPGLLMPDELSDLLRTGGLLGGSLPDGRRVGFIGTHPEGSMGMLEVLPRHRRKGYGRDLEAALINRHLERGEVPWCQVFEENGPSLQLQRDLGLVAGPANTHCFVDCRPWE